MQHGAPPHPATPSCFVLHRVVIAVSNAITSQHQQHLQLSLLQLVIIRPTMKFSSTTLLLASLTSAREISFPPVSGYTTSDQVVLGGYDFLDLSQPKFAGLSTYANLPYVHCLAKEGEEVEKFDIAILGAPFDTVSHEELCDVSTLSGSRGRRRLIRYGLLKMMAVVPTLLVHLLQHRGLGDASTSILHGDSG